MKEATGWGERHNCPISQIHLLCSAPALKREGRLLQFEAVSLFSLYPALLCTGAEVLGLAVPMQRV